MLIIINPYAACGNAMKKWNSFEHYIKKKGPYRVISLANTLTFINEQIQESINNGEREFVAAGGDGTVNFILNAIMKHHDPDVIKDIKIGAVGLGSSNDFHKPFKMVLNNIPHKINFKTAKYRDVGFIRFSNGNIENIMCFLINASIGLTAYGNYIFNHPNKILDNLKKWNSSLAIVYAALKSILNYNNINAKIECRNCNVLESKISNLGIIKNPNFSGNLSYSTKINYDNGLFNIHLAENLTKIKSILLFWKLSTGKVQDNPIKTWDTDGLSISSDKEFQVELDGETITTSSVLFGIFPKKILVCES